MSNHRQVSWWQVTVAGLTAALSLAAAPPVFEVVNGPYESFEQAAAVVLSADQVEALDGMALAEADSGGGRAQPVTWALDRSGPAPVLAWVMPGITPPGAARRFVAVPGTPPTVSAGDLRVTQTDTTLTIANAYFEVTHRRQGGGGFPENVLFRVSGNRDAELFFLDRLHRAAGAPEERGGFEAGADPQSTAQVVFESPVRVIVEARTHYARNGKPAPGNPRVVYRYVYTPFSPVIEVTADAAREDDLPWSEQHFLHLSRKTYRYSSFVAGEPPVEHIMQAPGTKSKAVNGSRWAVMATESDAAGVGGGPTACWDASDEFVYYVTRSRGPWPGREAHFEGCLYYGPAAADTAWYTRWLGAQRTPQVRIVSGLEATGPAAAAEPPNAFALRNDAMALSFADAAGGFACTGIRALADSATRFVNPREGAPGFWRLSLRSPVRKLADGSKESPFDEVVLDNRSPAELTAIPGETAEGKTLTFAWKGLDLPGEADAVDVTATVLLRPARGESEWRLKVANRSTRFGLWEASYPLLTSVCLPGTADVLQPRGNWGGTLVRQSRAAASTRYPSAAGPVQFMAFNLGNTGLYLGAHDDGARTKRLTISAEQDAAVVTLAEGAGQPGSAEVAPFPVVITTYAGDWWQAAKRYRQWATGQTWARKGWIQDRQDVPRIMKDIGLWWLGGGTAEEARTMMEQAEQACPLPIGLHWYSWHQIPFDNSYPEYFPTKPGVAEAVRELTGRGQVIMPYINGRLWDRDIPSFAERGIPAACKQPDGQVYIEEYGSKRKLCPMCPTTGLWQDTMAEVCHRLITECGVNAIYLDQIGAAAPAPCFDPAHGHPLGGGRHWVDGYRVLLDRVKAEAAAKGVGLTTENTAEPYIDNIDGYLAWNPRYDTDVPLLPAVYSGYTIYFTSPQDARDDLDAFAMAQGRDFLWGCQLGWNGSWLLGPEHREKLAFELELCRMRLAGKDFMVFGELVGEVRPLHPLPLRTTVWNRSTPHPASLPTVQGTLWRTRDGRLGVFLVNYGDRPAAIAYELRPGDWLAAAAAGWLVQRLTPQGTSPWQEVAEPVVRRQDVLGAREVRALVLSPADKGAAKAARKLAASADPVLAACAHEFLFGEAVRRAGLAVTLPTALQTVVRGEPLALEVRVAAQRRGADALTVRWPDGASETVTAKPDTEVRLQRLAWAGDGSAAQDSVPLELRVDDVAVTTTVCAVYQDALEVTSGWPAAVRGGESFVMPVSVVNHSRSARRARVLFDRPEGWQIEPAATCDAGQLAPGETRSLLLRVRVPPAAQESRVTLQARVVEGGTAHDVQVLKSRPVAAAPRAAKPPVIDGRFTEWSGGPLLRLGAPAGDTVRIEKDYGGPADCSAEVRAQWDEANLYLAIAVTDNVQFQEEGGFQLWRGDCLQLAFRNGPPNRSSGYDGTEREIGLTLAPQGPLAFEWMPAAAPCRDVRLSVVRDGTVTRYEAAIPWTALGVQDMRPARRLAWSMTVNDNDGAGFRGWLEWTPGVCGDKDSSAFGWFEAVAP